MTVYTLGKFIIIANKCTLRRTYTLIVFVYVLAINYTILGSYIKWV